MCYLIFPLSPLLVDVSAKGAFGHVLQHREVNSSKLHTGSSLRSQSVDSTGGPQTKRQRRTAARLRERWKGPKLHRRCCTWQEMRRPWIATRVKRHFRNGGVGRRTDIAPTGHREQRQPKRSSCLYIYSRVVKRQDLERVPDIECIVARDILFLLILDPL